MRDSQATRARFDTRVGAIYVIIDLTRRDLARSDELLRISRGWRAGNVEDADFTAFVADYLWKDYAAVMRHETHHLHQALAYPGLFLRATRETQMILEPLRWFREQKADIPLTPGADEIPETAVSGPIGSAPTEVDEIRRSYYAPLARYGLRLEGEHVRPFDVDLSDEGARFIREYDLLEDESLVWEFLLQSSGSAGPDSTGGTPFKSWLRGAAVDCVTFNLLERLGFTPDAALWTLPALVYFAYQTTIPMGAFTTLVEGVRAHGLHRMSEPDDSYLMSLTLLCSEIVSDTFPPPPASFAVLGLSQNDPPALLSSVRAKIAAEADNPLTGYFKQIETDFSWPAPADFCWPDAQTRRLLETRYPSPYTFVRLLHPDLDQGSIGFSLRRVDADELRDFVLNLDCARPLFDLLFFAGLEGMPTHNCPHTSCANRTRLCWDYTFFPWRWEDCGFPALFEDQCLHSISVAEGLLKFSTRERSQ